MAFQRGIRPPRTLNAALLAYRDLDAMDDLRAILNLINDGASSQAEILSLAPQRVFSHALRGAVGQCLDYRTNDNSRHNLAWTDSHLELVAAHDASGRPRLNGMLYLAPAKDQPKGQETVLALDPLYTSDGSALSWEKMIGFMLFALERSKQSRIPLFIPQSSSGLYREHILSQLKEAGCNFKDTNLKLSIIAAAQGSIYLELEGYDS
jgi:hypothetical protein